MDTISVPMAKPKEIAVTLKASSFFYDTATDSYHVKFTESQLISNDTMKQTVVISIPTSKVQQSSQTQQLKDDEIDSILDEIAAKEKYKKLKLRKFSTNKSEHPDIPELDHNATSNNTIVTNTDTSYQHTPNQSADITNDTTKGNEHTKGYSKASEKEKLEKKLASIPKPRKQAKIDIEPNKPRPKSPGPSRRQKSKRSTASHSASPRPSPPKQTRTKSKVSTKDDVSKGGLPDLSKTKLTSSMKEEWLSCCDYRTEDECTGDDGAGCIAMKRVKFVLEHYSSWMKYKSFNSNDAESDDDDSSDGDSSDGGSQAGIDYKANKLILRSYEWISDFFTELGGYSYVELSDDFEHIRDFHMKLNKNKTSETIQYFDTSLGKCADKQCSCLARHCRDRHIDNINEKKRREIFFIKMNGEEGGDGKDEQKKKDGEAHKGGSKKKKKKVVKKNTVKENKMYSEINLQTKLDTIHITLRHHHLRLINTDKFITKIYGNDGEHQQNNKKKQEIDNKEDDIFRRMTKYSFGESITYWDSKHHRYCDSKYADIRSELLNNKIYPLSQDLYNTIKNRAVSFLKTKKGKATVAKREHDWMKKWKILKNSVITVDHIIALICYVNVTALRRVFKLHGFVRRKKDGNKHDDNSLSLSHKRKRKSTNKDKEYKKNYELRDNLLDRHREIWHWSRLLLECVHCYGIPLSSNMNYYHGIDCKLLFNRFNVMFDIPTSLTLNRDIAYNLSRTINYGRGIAIELSHGGLSDLQSLCLDLSYLSDYPSEEEQLVFHSYLSFNDVIINRMHHDEWLKILRFWYKIKEGFFFNHLIENNKITRNDQLCICAMIINMIIANDKHPRYDTRIPQYMQNLFNECVENNTFVWIIESEYSKMIKKLQNLLFFDNQNIMKSSQFIQYLIKYKKCNVCNANIFNWKIKSNDFQLLFDKTKKNKWISSPQYIVYMNSNVTSPHDDDNILKFHFECQNKAKNNLFRCRIHLDYKPDNVAKINLGMGLFCKAANNFDNYSYGELRYDKLYNVSLHSLFQTKILKKNCKNQSFTLKLQIQLFYIYDFNGKLIPINQSQTIKPQNNQSMLVPNTPYYE